MGGIGDRCRETFADEFSEFTDRRLFKRTDMGRKGRGGMMGNPDRAMQDTRRDAGDFQRRQGFAAGQHKSTGNQRA